MILFIYSADVINMLDYMIKVVDEELSEGPMSIGEAVPPHIKHWNRLVMMLRDQAVGVVAPPAVILAMVVVTPISLSCGWVSESHLFVSMVILTWTMSRLFKRLLSRYQDTRILNNMHQRTAQGEHHGEADVGSHDGENAPGGHGGESSQGVVETIHTQGGGDTRGTTNSTSQGWDLARDMGYN